MPAVTFTARRTTGGIALNAGLGWGTVFELSPVPEPSTLKLLALGAIGLAVMRRG